MLLLLTILGLCLDGIYLYYRYVPHANRSLRSINMHLNMRRAPRSISSYLPTALRSSSPVPAIINTTPKNLAGTGTTKRSASSTPQVIPPIPPTSNPRGELIFSSRVDRTFKDGYERYRSAFEKRREEKLREQRKARGWWFGWTKKNSTVSGISSTRPSSLVDGQRRSGSGTPPTSLGRTSGGIVNVERSRSTSPSVLNVNARREMELSTLSTPSTPSTPSTRGNNTSSSSSGRSPSHLREFTGAEEEEERRSRSRAESYSFILNSLGNGGTSVEEDLRRRSEIDVGKRDGLKRIVEDVG